MSPETLQDLPSGTSAGAVEGDVPGRRGLPIGFPPGRMLVACGREEGPSLDLCELLDRARRPSEDDVEEVMPADEPFSAGLEGGEEVPGGAERVGEDEGRPGAPREAVEVRVLLEEEGDRRVSREGPVLVPAEFLHRLDAHPRDLAAGLPVGGFDVFHGPEGGREDVDPVQPRAGFFRPDPLDERALRERRRPLLSHSPVRTTHDVIPRETTSRYSAITWP